MASDMEGCTDFIEELVKLLDGLKTNVHAGNPMYDRDRDPEKASEAREPVSMYLGIQLTSTNIQTLYESAIDELGRIQNKRLPTGSYTNRSLVSDAVEGVYYSEWRCCSSFTSIL